MHHNTIIKIRINLAQHVEAGKMHLLTSHFLNDKKVDTRTTMQGKQCLSARIIQICHNFEAITRKRD